MSSPRKRPYDEAHDHDTSASSIEPDGGPRARRPALRISPAPSSRASSVTAVTSPITKKCTQLSKKTRYFTVPKDCLQETDDLLLPDEAPPVYADGHEPTLPVRILKDFIIYDEARNNMIVSVQDINDPGTSVRAYGLVAPMPQKSEDDDEADYDDEQDEEEYEGAKTYELNLSSIFVYFVNPDPTEPMLWLRTQFAWYILDRPDEKCMAAYVPYWKSLYVGRLALSRTHALREWYGLAYDSVTQEELGGPVSLFSASFTDEEINVKNACDEAIFEDLSNDSKNDGALDALEAAWDELFLEKNVRTKSKRPRTSQSPPATPRKKKGKNRAVRPGRGKPNMEIEVLKHRNPTYATPFVRQLAAVLCFRLYRQTIKEEEGLVDAGADLTCDPKTVLDDAFSFSCDPEGGDHRWKLCDKRDPEYMDEVQIQSYRSAFHDNVSLKAGDFVVIRGDPKDDDQPGVKRKNKGGNVEGWVHWFGQVIFFYKDNADRSPYAHVRWLTHSSQTQLGESGHPRELMLRTICGSVPMMTVVNKINVKYIRPGRAEPTGWPYRAEDQDSFFYRYAVKEESGDLICASRFMFSGTEECDNINEYGCFTCHLQTEAAIDGVPRLTKPGLLLFNGVSYHLYDFVYIGARSEVIDRKKTAEKAKLPKPFRIGQLVRMGGNNNQMITVRLFERYDDVLSADQVHYKDHKRLVASQRKVNFQVERLRGICYVMHRDSIRSFDTWVKEDNHFYVDHMRPDGNTERVRDATSLKPLPISDIRYCDDATCNDKRMEVRSPQPLRKLRALDLYHGAGGLSCGLEKAGAFETHWAIDFSPSAHVTFKANFPHATAILQCANEVLKHAIEGRNRPLYPIDGGKEACAALPKPGEVDIVVCGPPCQGYSILNSHRRTDDIKNTLVANALSYVDHLRPRYFLLENVQPLLNSRGKVLTPGETEERIVENAVRKFIVRFLVSRGYQVRVTVLQAGQFGAAQHRARAFFWAAKRGENLPEFPLPTHTWETTVLKTKRDPLGGAPLPCVGSEDMIGDLQEWHWMNPKRLHPNTMIPEPGGPVFDAVTYDRKSRATGYTDFVAYGKRAMTAYQRALRGSCKGSRYHATMTYAAESVERVCNIPAPDEARGIPSGLDYRELGASLTVWHLTSPHSQAAKGHYGEGKYARVWVDKPARTVLTRNEPTGKQGRVLHPRQYRVMSGQENARLQGFSDSFTFLSREGDFRDIMRLIGNAVPIPLGYNLGRELAKALLANESEGVAMSAVKEEEQEASPSPEL